MKITEQKILDAIQSFINANDWDESKNILEKQQEVLLSKQADKVFAKLLKQYYGDEEITEQLEYHRDIIHRAREIGIEAAFAEIDDEEEAEYADISPELLDRLRAIQSPKEVLQLLDEHPELEPLLQHLTEFAAQHDPDIALMITIQAWVTSETWEECQAYLHQHPELLTDKADRFITELIQQQIGEEEDIEIFEEHQNILRRARIIGIDEAFAEARAVMDEDDHGDFIINFPQNGTFPINFPPELLAHFQNGQMKTDVHQLLGEPSDVMPTLQEMIQYIGLPIPDEALMKKIEEWITSPSWEESRAYLHQHPELLTDEAEMVITMLILQPNDEDDEDRENFNDMLEGHRYILERARAIGIDAAFDEMEEWDEDDKDWDEEGK